jgi:nitrate reductase gamma subunit
VWGVAGLALGVALTVGTLRVAGRRRNDQPELTTTEPRDDVLTSTGAPVRR